MATNSNSLRQGNWKYSILGFFVFIIGIALIGFIVYVFWKALAAISPSAATVIVGSVTVLGSVLSLIFSKHQERKREIEQEHRRQKIPIYEEFMAFWFKVLMFSKDGTNKVSEKEILEFMNSFTQKLLVWGSDKVVKQYSDFRRRFAKFGAGTSEKPIEPLFVFEKLIYAIRSDVGHKNTGLVRGDLLALFITDIDNYINVGQK